MISGTSSDSDAKLRERFLKENSQGGPSKRGTISDIEDRDSESEIEMMDVDDNDYDNSNHGRVYRS